MAAAVSTWNAPGSPTVLLEAGYRSPATARTEDLVQPDNPRPMVFSGVAGFTRVCAHERPGAAAIVDDVLRSSRSDPVPMPRTAESVVADLHALLAAAAVPCPFVIVGHSLGGLFVRLYAATYPDDVVGLVQRDTPLPPMPPVVLAHGIPFGKPFPGWPGAEMEAIMLALQKNLARLVPNACFAIATESGLNIHQDHPEQVIDAIREVVEAVRDPGTWAAPAVGTPAS